MPLYVQNKKKKKKMSVDDELMTILFFPENRIWYFLQVVS